jgi:hypothetical protein
LRRRDEDEPRRFVLVCCDRRSALFRFTTSQDADRISLENIVEESGINFVFANSDTANRHQVETMVAGVAVFDVSMKTAIS